MCGGRRSVGVMSIRSHGDRVDHQHVFSLFHQHVILTLLQSLYNLYIYTVYSSRLTLDALLVMMMDMVDLIYLCMHHIKTLFFSSFSHAYTHSCFRYISTRRVAFDNIKMADVSVPNHAPTDRIIDRQMYPCAASIYSYTQNDISLCTTHLCFRKITGRRIEKMYSVLRIGLHRWRPQSRYYNIIGCIQTHVSVWLLPIIPYYSLDMGSSIL